MTLKIEPPFLIQFNVAQSLPDSVGLAERTRPNETGGMMKKKYQPRHASPNAFHSA